MGKFMLGKKAGMTQLFNEEGNAVPVTVIDCGPLTVVQKKTVETDGYNAIQVAYDEIRENLLNKPKLGQFEKAGTKTFRTLREFRVDDVEAYELGQELNVGDVFEVGDAVDITGTSKGKGFQGNVKRHNQAGGHEGHGSRYHRRVGSLGPSTMPSRVLKGKKLPGQMGNKKVTVQNLEIVLVDAERNLLAVKGAVPGSRGNTISIANTVKVRNAE